MSDGTQQRMGIGRRVAFAGVLLVLVLVAIEGLATVAYRMASGEGYSRGALARQRAEAAGSSEAGPGRVPTYVANKSIHPYVGFVADRLDGDGNPITGISTFGYLDDEPPLRERAEDRVVVGLVGGSVAMGFGLSEAARTTLRETLEASGWLGGRRLELVRIAIAGYHQPQQLMTVAYLLSLGAEFDVVLNLDGFNEVALHPAENGRMGVFPAYPRAWAFQAASVVGASDDAYRLALARRREWASGFPPAWLARWRAPNVVWWLRDRALARALEKRREAATRHAGKARTFAQSGPPLPYATQSAMMQELAGLWTRSSRQLSRLCRANGIRYVHLLQPNQYDEGSKPMGEEERKRSVNPDHPYRLGVEQGYPLLRAAGAALRAEGVEFHDLSQVFAGHEEPLYIDVCCHFNEEGFAILARAMAEAMMTEPL